MTFFLMVDPKKVMILFEIIKCVRFFFLFISLFLMLKTMNNENGVKTANM